MATNGDIVTDAAATFAALTVLATKTDAVARTDAECATYSGAEWANEVDKALKDQNAVNRGAAGAYFWQTFLCMYNNAGSTARYVSWYDQTDRGATSNFETKFSAPYDGELVKARLVSGASTMGSTTIALLADATGDPSTALETSGAVNVASADTPYEFTFTSASAFTKGDILAALVTPTGVHGDVVVSFVFKFDTNT